MKDQPAFDDQTIAVVVPAYNEESKIAAMLAGIPDYVAKIFVIDDCSKDKTAEIVRERSRNDARITLLRPKENIGVGGAIVMGYKAVIESGHDIAVVMAGDGQMDPVDLPILLKEIVEDKCDYAKGNRFLRGSAEISKIPRHRIFGNLILSVLTKIVSGYWHVSDSQSGYTAINRRALEAVNWDQCYPRYGCPNDYLVRLNIANMRVSDVPITAVYGENWTSSMRSWKVIGPILRLLFRLFGVRMFRKYVVANGHPIIFFYLASFLGFLVSGSLFVYILTKFALTGVVPQTATILFGIATVGSLQLMLSGFEMDYRDNEWLCIHHGR